MAVVFSCGVAEGVEIPQSCSEGAPSMGSSSWRGQPELYDTLLGKSQNQIHTTQCSEEQKK